MTRSSEAMEDSEVAEEHGRGLSTGEILADEVGVESEVAIRRTTVRGSGGAVVDMVGNLGSRRLRVPKDKGDVLGFCRDSGRLFPVGRSIRAVVEGEAREKV